MATPPDDNSDLVAVNSGPVALGTMARSMSVHVDSDSRIFTLIVKLDLHEMAATILTRIVLSAIGLGPWHGPLSGTGILTRCTSSRLTYLKSI